MDAFEVYEPPPPYSAGPSPAPDRDTVFNHHHAPDVGQTFDCIEQHIANAKHCHVIRRHGHDKFTIERICASSFSVGAKIEGEAVTSDGITRTTLYANSSRIGTARIFGHRSDYVELHLGPTYSPPPAEWKSMKLARNGLLHSPSYEFEAGCQRLAWKHFHGPHLRGGSGDWILEDLTAVGSIAVSIRMSKRIT